MAAHTTQFASRMRTRAAFRTFLTNCNTCAHFCKLGTQSVSSLFSTQPAPCMRCALPTALITRLAQATPFSALELSTGGPFGNICAACNAHMVVAFPSQPAARAGHDVAFRRRKFFRHPAALQHGPWRLSSERGQQRRQRQQRHASSGSNAVHGPGCPVACPVPRPSQRPPAPADDLPVRPLHPP